MHIPHLWGFWRYSNHGATSGVRGISSCAIEHTAESNSAQDFGETVCTCALSGRHFSAEKHRIETALFFVTVLLWSVSEHTGQYTMTSVCFQLEHISQPMSL